MIKIHSIRETKPADETVLFAMDLVSKFAGHGKCEIAREITMQAVANRILRKEITPPQNFKKG